MAAGRRVETAQLLSHMEGLGIVEPPTGGDAAARELADYLLAAPGLDPASGMPDGRPRIMLSVGKML